ncbi:TRAP transporter large permease subunit [Pusillimonas sp. TS35]|uniref:TRAP transporter large permease n=1 Tax=Paracandidimonas lactea TaxID=2895524 RepID=UPI00136FBF26|nr:TRAP transporter large permease subunit [Paracandidimonas lactea]MYN11749.1 TRAP transporter large permease subunit [Pusillimonas sp. TS35]
MTVLVFLVSLCGAMALGIPIAFSLLVCGIALMVFLGEFDTQILASNLLDGADNFPLMAIPFFILAGELMNAGGISRRIIEFAMSLVGHVRGGLGYVAIIASVIFAGLSGSAVADTAALAAVLVPMMVAAGHDRAESGALIAASGIIAPIIPPSVPMIVFGVTAGVSISKLFMSGIVPGLMLAVFLAIGWAYMTRKGKFKVRPRSNARQIAMSARAALWAIGLPVIIVVGLRGGVFTPTEAAAIAAWYALFVGAVVYRELSMRMLLNALVSSAKTSAVIMLLAAAAMVSSYLITLANIPEQLTGFLEPLKDNKILLMLAINVVVLLVGTAMDVMPTILILTPVLMPIVKMAGIDPVYFGLMFIFNNCIGLLTPPVGTVLNVAAGVGRMSMESIIKAVMPFVWIEVALLLLLTLFPDLVIVPMQFLTQR